MTRSSRRTFLQGAVGVAATAILPTPAFSAVSSVNARTRIGHGTTKRRLFIQNRRSEEIFDGVYAQGGALSADALDEIDRLMRDKRSGEVTRIDRNLIELLGMVQRIVGFDEPIQMISGYRTRASNARLRKAAKNSYHIKGMAVDFRIKGISCHHLREIGERLQAGGVGYYPKRDFIHLDTGPVRSWCG